MVAKNLVLTMVAFFCCWCPLFLETETPTLCQFLFYTTPTDPSHPRRPSFNLLVSFDNCRLHDDVILRPEFFTVLLSCANQIFCYLNVTEVTKFKYERKNKKNYGCSSKMMQLCKRPICSHCKCFRACRFTKTELELNVSGIAVTPILCSPSKDVICNNTDSIRIP